MTLNFITTRELKPDWFSRFCMWWQKVDFSHAAVVFTDPRDGVEKVFEAADKGVTLTPFAPFASGHHIINHIQRRITVSEDYALGWIDGQVGKEYSELQLLYVGKFIRWGKNGRTKFICVELSIFTAQVLTGLKVDEDLDRIDLVETKTLLYT